MKIIVEAPGALEAENVKCEGDTLSLTPLFYGSGVDSTAAIVKVYSTAGVQLGVYTLKLSGKTGKVTLINRAKPVKPLMEQVK